MCTIRHCAPPNRAIPLETGVRPDGGTGERGAILVHVAVAFAGLVAFSALTIDLGVMWAARRQAQNAADSATLAAAVTLATSPGNENDARAAAQAVSDANPIWGEAAINPDITFPEECPPGAPSAPGPCVRVEVGRSTSTGSPLPIYIARMFGLASQNVRAVGTSKVLTGNATNCLRPIAIPDRWEERYPTTTAWTWDSLFERYDDAGPPPVPLGLRDSYSPPTSGDPGTGFTVSDMTGVQVQLTRPGNLHEGVLIARNYVQLDLPRATGSVGDEEANYLANIESCNGLTVSIGDWRDAYDNHSDATNNGLQALIDSDPGASYDAGSGTIRGSAFVVSPRLITIGVFDPDAYAQAARPNMRISVRLRNMVGFFVESTYGEGGITGVILPQAGTFNSSTEYLTDQASFLRSVALVR